MFFIVSIVIAVTCRVILLYKVVILIFKGGFALSVIYCRSDITVLIVNIALYRILDKRNVVKGCCVAVVIIIAIYSYRLYIEVLFSYYICACKLPLACTAEKVCIVSFGSAVCISYACT